MSKNPSFSGKSIGIAARAANGAHHIRPYMNTRFPPNPAREGRENGESCGNNDSPPVRYYAWRHDAPVLLLCPWGFAGGIGTTPPIRGGRSLLWWIFCVSEIRACRMRLQG